MANERDAFLAEVEASLKAMFWNDGKVESAGKVRGRGRLDPGTPSGLG